MQERIHKLTGRLLLAAVLVGTASAPLRAQQSGQRKEEPRPKQEFSGSLFGGAKAERKEVESKAEGAAPSPSPEGYVIVVAKVRPRDGEGDGQQTAPAQNPPAPSANNPPPSTAPAQGPQTASPTQSQTQQSTNPAAPAQGQQPAQPSVPATAPANPPAGQPSTGVRPAQGTGQPAVTPSGQVSAPQGPQAPGTESVVPTSPQGPQLDVPQVAPDFRASEGPFPVLDRVGVDMGEQRALSVREAVEMALANNKDIEVARASVRAAEFDLRAARGVYDPRFLTSTYYERTETPAASFLSGSASGAVTQSGLFSSSSVQGLTPRGGGGYRLDFVTNRVSTDNQFAALNPQYPTALTFNYTQPILRGRAFDQNRRQIEIAKKNLSLTDAQFRQRAIETITSVQRAYWDLVYALRNLQIQRDAVRDARAQLEHNKRLVREGQLAPIDIVAAEAQISGFEQSVYTALDDVGRTENNLKNLIAENRESPLWRVALVPADSVDVVAPQVSLDDAMGVALKNRPELQSSDVAAAVNEIEQRFAREQSKPQVDLVASYGAVGLAGPVNTAAGDNPLTASSAQLRERINELSRLSGLRPLDPPAAASLPEALVGGYGQSLTNLAANRFTNFRVGLAVNLPFRNTTAEAQLGRTLVERDRIRTQREQLEQLIQVDVRNAIQLVRTAESRLRASASARSASEQQYASEQRKLEAGQSTVFLVLERQTALTTARGNELRAQTELNKAVADLQRATGNALEQNRVEIVLK
ncbi:MAG TPA: TolC family protein [Pyrinomonadaceae bacterium]|jgi:HAE1 family hydrophobic/amphiphilic exporter-1|nr:TolC family protein [Pyrinomonadaceae bacterium]